MKSPYFLAVVVTILFVLFMGFISWYKAHKDYQEFTEIMKLLRSQNEKDVEAAKMYLELKGISKKDE